MRGGVIVEAGEGAHQAGVGVLVAAEQVLEGGAARRRGHTRLERVGRQALEVLEQGGVRRGEVAGGRVRVRGGAQDAGALRVVCGQQAQRGAVPAGGGGGGPGAGAGARRHERGDGGAVPLAGGARDVVGELDGGRAVRRQRRRAAGVRGHLERLRGRRVHGAAHQRVPEAEAPRHVRVAHEVAAQQLVERLHDLRLVAAGGFGREVELERIARDGRRFEHLALGPRQHGELAVEGRRDRPRDACARERDVGPRLRPVGPARHACELQQVVRVAAAVAVQARRRGVLRRRAQQPRGVGKAERRELQAHRRARARRALERRGQRLGHLAWP